MYKKEEVKKEVRVAYCDVCGTKIGNRRFYDIRTCSCCGRDLCNNCMNVDGDFTVCNECLAEYEGLKSKLDNVNSLSSKVYFQWIEVCKKNKAKYRI